MNNLRNGLGGQPPQKSALPALGLTLHELSELIRRAGRVAGFIVESEYKVRLDGGGNVKKIDWVWLSPSTFSPIVAIEVEGHGVYPNSIAADISKFRVCGALLNVIALFQVDHNRTIKRLPPHGIAPKDWVSQHAASFPVDILLDEDFMVSGGVEKFQKRALELLKNCN